MATTITSPANPRIKAYARLHNRRHRDAAGRFIVEGHRELSRAVDAGVELECIVSCPDFLDEGRAAFVTEVEAQGVEHLVASEAAFRKIAYRRHPDGVLAIVHTWSTDLSAMEPGTSALVLVAEGIEKPGNLGAMLRTADAAGVDALVLADPATDPFNPNVVRASQGSLFGVPLAVATPRETVRWAGSHGLALVAATPMADTALWDVDLTRPVGIVIGAEHAGLGPAWDDVAERVTIPMAGTADSLNAATAAALLLFEAVRQRRAAHR